MTHIGIKKTWGGIAAVVVCTAVITFWTIQSHAQNGQGAAQTGQIAPGQVGVLDQLSNAFITVADHIKPAVVSIEVTQKIKLGGGGDNSSDNSDQSDNSGGGGDEDMIPPQLREFFGDQMPPEMRRFFGQQMPREYSREGVGSGVIVDARKGYILTNNHVVRDASVINVTLSDNREFKAKVIGADKSTDVAVIQIPAKNLTEAKLGSSDNLRVGEIVMAIGSPFALGGTVTQGIISATNRQTGILGEFGYENFLQTDAAVNPGNSGGPLVNLRGEVVGMNTAIATGTGAFAGVSFAVPIDLAKSVMNDLITKGKVTRGYVGVEIGPIDATWARRLNMDVPYGALVNSVTPGGPAEKAGLREGDVVIEMNGKRVEDYSRFRYDIGSMPPGTKVNLTILRENQRQNVQVTLAPRPTDEELAKMTSGNVRPQRGNRNAPTSTDLKKLGLSVQNLTPDVAQRLGISPAKGVLITDVDQNGPAAQKGLQPQMVITGVEKQQVNNVSELQRAVNQALKQQGMVLLHVTVEGRSRLVLIEPNEAESNNTSAPATSQDTGNGAVDTQGDNAAGQ